MRRHCGKDGRENKKRLRHGLSVLRICGSERIVVRRKHFRKPFYADKGDEYTVVGGNDGCCEELTTPSMISGRVRVYFSVLER